MLLRPRVGVFLLALTASSVGFAGNPRPCLTPDDAVKMFNKDICLAAHVYNVVQLPDGTRFLDVCSPETPDEGCRFTVVSHRDDRTEVGDLAGYGEKDVEIRGTVEPMHGRSGMVLSHVRQFSGGPPKFRPNPRLLRGFGGDQEKPPIADPNLRRQGGRRAFMNQRDQEAVPRK